GEIRSAVHDVSPRTINVTMHDGTKLVREFPNKNVCENWVWSNPVRSVSWDVSLGQKPRTDPFEVPKGILPNGLVVTTDTDRSPLPARFSSPDARRRPHRVRSPNRVSGGERRGRPSSSLPGRPAPSTNREDLVT